MKLKVSLQRAGGDQKDLLVTADAVTTVGDLGRYLKLADPAFRVIPGAPDGEFTLGVISNGVQTLDARTPLAESPIRSGSTITVVPAGQQFAEGHSKAVAMATVLSGPDCGKEFPLASGTNIVGRQRSCEVRLSDGMVSRSHARLNISSDIEIIDLGSANGVELNGSLISRETVRPTDEIRVGDTVFAVRFTQVASAEGRTDSASVGFIRSPRLAPQFVGQEFEVADPPQRQERQPFPALLMVFPLLMAGVMYFASGGEWRTVIFSALMPLMMVASWWEQRRRTGKANSSAVAGFRADLDLLVSEAEQLAGTEVQQRQREYPSAAECLEAVTTRSPLLWTRRPRDWGFLELRAGLGTCPSRSTIKLPTGKNGMRDLVAEARERTRPLTVVGPVPVVLRPSETGGMGVAGPRSAAVSAARALVVQATALHSPAELAVTLVTSQRSGDDWRWLTWLPHVDSAWSPVEARHLASTPSSAGNLVSSLEVLISERLAQQDSAPKTPAVLLIVESDSPVEFGRLVDLAERGWAVGVHVLWIAPELGQLPAACRSFLDTRTVAESGVGYVHEASLVTPVATETVTAEQALAFARSLAPLIDLGARNEDVSDLPRSISFLSMDGYETLGDQPEAVIERWNQNHSVLTGPKASEPVRKEASLRAAVGQRGGHLHTIDLRTDGPHALVGGTTGAGKSELLQSWILSMAANHSPQRLTFLLVDYKGGSAFADCNKLPHTVGMVTDLNQNGVQRALKSLSAELRHREHVLERAKAKDLMALEKRGATDAPPSLVIVVDEFAALVQEVPEFVDGVVNVAQRGRSLGLHLILATQRPAGVIKDNLRANTNLRLALRVADEADSTDVLGSADAAFFDPNLPGRAVSKTGPGRLVPFQTAYAGGHTGTGPATADIRVEEMGLGTAISWEIPEALLPPRPVGGKSDITRVVESIQSATALAELPAPRKPWLPDLPSLVNIMRLPSSDTTAGRLAFGLLDNPDAQAQVTVSFEPDRHGNLAVFGASGSGKSAALRSLAATAGLNFAQGPTWVYGIDFGAGGLSMLEVLPHVGSVIPGSDDERVRRLLRWLQGIVEERTDAFKQVNADSVTQYRLVTGRSKEPRIVVLLDGVSAFLKAYETNTVWIDRLIDVAAKGRPLGIHFVMSADRAGALTTQLAATVQQRLVLRMTTIEEYDNLGAPRHMLPPDATPGRGIWGKFEVQVAVLGDAADLGGQAAELGTLGRWMVTKGASDAPPIVRLPELLPLSDLPFAVDDRVPIGISDDSMGPLSILPEGTFVVMGPPASGRTTAMQTIVAAVRRTQPSARAYLLTLDRRSPLLRDPVWTKKAVGVDDAQTLADELTGMMLADLTSPVVVVIDRIADWSGTFVEMPIETLIKGATRAGAFVVTDGEAGSFSRSFGLEASANASRVGFALQPDTNDGAGFGVRLPLRLNKADFPPGRGFLFRAGRAELGHLAFPGTVEPR